MALAFPVLLTCSIGIFLTVPSVYFRTRYGTIVIPAACSFFGSHG